MAPRTNRIARYDESMNRTITACCILGLALFLGACSGDGSDDSSTTAAGDTTVAPVTSLAATASTTTSPATSTAPTTTADLSDPPEFPEYTIVSREDGEAGDTVVVLIGEGTLTDIDLANVLADVVDRFPPILTAYLVDHPDAATAVLAEEPTAEQLELLDRHYLVRLEEGFRMVFEGPFADTPDVILGS